jgi:hypothetical protein
LAEIEIRRQIIRSRGPNISGGCEGTKLQIPEAKIKAFLNGSS